MIDNEVILSEIRAVRRLLEAEVWTVDEASQKTGIPKPAIRAAIKTSEVPILPGRTARFHKVDFDALFRPHVDRATEISKRLEMSSR